MGGANSAAIFGIYERSDKMGLVFFIFLIIWGKGLFLVKLFFMVGAIIFIGAPLLAGALVIWRVLKIGGGGRIPAA